MAIHDGILRAGSSVASFGDVVGAAVVVDFDVNNTVAAVEESTVADPMALLQYMATEYKRHEIL